MPIRRLTVHGLRALRDLGAPHRRRSDPAGTAPRRPWAVAAAAGLVVGGLSPGPAAAAPVERTGLSLDYDIYFSGFHLATADIEVDLLPDAYRVAVAAESDGLIGILSSWRTRAETEGRRDGAAVRPESHRVERPRDDDLKITRMTFAPDGGIEVLVTPGDHTDGGGVPPELRRGALDPLSAALGVIAGAPDPAAACNRTVEIYDARRRYDAVVAAAVPDTLEANRYAAYAGPAARCTLRLEPIAGAFGGRDGDDGGGWQRDRDGQLADGRDRSATLWLARALPDGPLMPVRIEADTRLGRIIVHLSGIAPREPTLAERPAAQ
jgi:hypothetical protein